MNLYAILRRDGFTDGPTLEAAAARSTAVGEQMPFGIEVDDDRLASTKGPARGALRMGHGGLPSGADDVAFRLTETATP